MKVHAILFLLLASITGNASELLTERPEGSFVEIGGDVQMKHGFILWTPALTLAHVIEVVGGFTPQAKIILIERLSKDPAPDVLLRKVEFFRDARKQNRRFHHGDCITVTHFMKPW